MLKPASIYGMESIDFYSILTVAGIQVERTAPAQGTPFGWGHKSWVP